jgi:two-component system, cell cycle response regulator
MIEEYRNGSSVWPIAVPIRQGRIVVRRRRMPSSSPTVRLLLIEDSPSDAGLLRAALTRGHGGRFDLLHVERLGDGLDHLAEEQVDVALVDLSLPDSHGLESFRAVHDRAPDVPVIVLSGTDDDELAVRAVNEGAQDYLPKRSLEEPELLARSIRYAIERHRLISELRRLALVDQLTGLSNRRGFVALGEHLASVAGRTGQTVTVVYVDVDNMKQINDTFGHAEGDRALDGVAQLLRATFRAADVVARIGGDEFCVLLLHDHARDERPVHRLEEALARTNDGSSRPYELSLSVGAAHSAPQDWRSVENLIQQADAAMYRQKAGRPRVLVRSGSASRREVD